MEFAGMNLADPNLWVGLLTLTVLEVVLGIDNLVFISILAGKLPKDIQARARSVGLSLALVTRILLLLGISWMAGLTNPLFEIFNHPVAGRDLILGLGGIFLIGKATHEIHGKLEGEEGGGNVRVAPSFLSVIVQIMLLDIVFSLDSVITAVGMVREIPIMVVAIIIAMGFMLVFSGRISAFIDRHPTLKMLALSFLILIGVTLVAESLHREIPKGYIYFAMAFSVGVEILNINLRKKAPPVHLHQPYTPKESAK